MTQAIKDLRARYNGNGNAIIPNTFQHPNIFVDRLMFFLSPVENVVLTFAVRRILGFQDNIMSRKDNISLSQFTDGITKENGEPLALGCGVGTQAVIDALNNLELFKILIPTTEKADPKRGQEYWLQDNENAIDWDGLEKRKSQKSVRYAKRTKKARYSVRQRGSVGQTPKPLSDRPLGVSGTDTQNPRKPKETQIHGADAPQGLDWKLGHDQPVTQADLNAQKEAEYVNSAVLISMGAGINSNDYFHFALTFMRTRDILIPNDKCKGQRKPIKNMLEAGVTVVEVEQATKQLMDSKSKDGKRLTIVDLYAIEKTAIGLANTPKISSAPRSSMPTFIDGRPVFEES